MKHIVIDPGHGGTLGKDHFRQGPSGEREEWINLSVSKELKHVLESKGFASTLTRRNDKTVSLEERVKLAHESQADLFVSVHHASCDPVIQDINFPFFYIHDQLINTPLIQSFKNYFSNAGRGEAICFSDKWVFNDGLFVLRECEKKGIPAILTEYSFFSHPEEELKLKTRSYCQLEAKKIASAISAYFSEDSQLIKTDQLSTHAVNTEFTVSEPRGGSFPVDYKNQLFKIRTALIENKEAHWINYIEAAHKKFIKQEYQESVILFEKALALNPYHSNIKDHLQKMLICTEKLEAAEYHKNIDTLLDFIA